MRTIDEIKLRIQDKILSETELDNIMIQYDFLPDDSDNDDIIKYTNGRLWIWLDYARDNHGNVLIDNVRKAIKTKGVETKVEPFATFQDLRQVQEFFWNHRNYDYWLIGWLMVSLGRRVGDIINLRWSDIFFPNGEFRVRLSTLKEEKTGKVVGIYLNEFAKYCIREYMGTQGVQMTLFNGENIVNDDKIFKHCEAAFRKALKLAVNKIGLKYPVSTHSYRKFFGNMLYKLHPNDPDAIKMIQYIFGHSSEEITKMYIATIDEKKDRYVQDMSEFLSCLYKGENFQIDDSPVISLKTKDLREIIQSACLRQIDSNASVEDVLNFVNNFIVLAEQKQLK